MRQQKFKARMGSSVHIPSFSKTRSPWTVCTFGVIPEQGKKLNQNSLFHSSTAKRTYLNIGGSSSSTECIFTSPIPIFSWAEWPTLPSNM
jgi:hypothetical protein